jgi:hypothetical protein
MIHTHSPLSDCLRSTLAHRWRGSCVCVVCVCVCVCVCTVMFCTIIYCTVFGLVSVVRVFGVLGKAVKKLRNRIAKQSTRRTRIQIMSVELR